MTRKIFLTFVAFMIAMGCCIVMFVVKYEVVQKEEALYRINEKILSDQKEIHILKAELAHLTDPQRLRGLAKKHTNLREIKPFQIIQLSDMKKNEDMLRRVSYGKNGK